MRIAVITDIHGNLEALQACLAHARREGTDRFALLGDFVGYGAAPMAVVEIIASLAEQGAIVLRGNHEDAVTGTPAGFNPQARRSAEWTRGQLDQAAIAFLSGLPLTASFDGCLFAHASAHFPERWIYIDSIRTAGQCMNAYPEGIQLGVFGHVHRQALFHRAAADALPQRFDPVAGAEIPLAPGLRWAALAGSAGQPRDGNAAAAWMMIDRQHGQLTFHRVAYDVDSAAARILATSLPVWFARRLASGS